MFSKNMHNLPKPRECNLKLSPEFKGFGFKLHSNHRQTLPHSHQIYGVEAGSPASQAGLKNGDQVHAVNLLQIGNLTHKEILSIVAKGLEYDGIWHKDELILLVTDLATDRVYKMLNVELIVNTGSNMDSNFNYLLKL